MIIISHRGNLEGPVPELENKPDQIIKVLNLGFDVEVDVWNVDNQLFLGHDNPEYLIELEFLVKPNLWCHAKNISALDKMLQYDIHCFYHHIDDVTLTSKGFMWTYPGKDLFPKSICVFPPKEELNCFGVCTDYPISHLNLYNGSI